MSLAALLTEDVTIVRRSEGATDRYGRPDLVWVVAETVPGRVEPITSSELTDSADVLSAAFRLFVDAETAITGRDRVRVGNETYEVIGAVQVHKSPSGSHHIEARLRRLT